VFKTGSTRQQDRGRQAGGGLLGSLRKGLNRTRDLLFTDIGDLIGGGAQLDEDTLEDLETRLLQADVGIEATDAIIEQLRNQARQQGDRTPVELLRQAMLDILEPVTQPLSIEHSPGNPFIILAVGVNGVGKTTTLGKLAAYYKRNGYKALLAAGDTFRAAAIEQLQAWGERAGLPVIAQPHGSDAASVIYDAIASARARGCDIVLADTAGRLHTKDHLMTELKKVRRVVDKFDPPLHCEVLLVLDAGTGQNALAQAREFHHAVGLTGIALTKLDGTAKGGIIFALAQTLGLPIRFIGVGEQMDDLQPFNAEQFINALLTTNT
jgi:fused signal recognition particle receptor